MEFYSTVFDISALIFWVANLHIMLCQLFLEGGINTHFTITIIWIHFETFYLRQPVDKN